jgi:periplasmic protein TonB
MNPSIFALLAAVALCLAGCDNKPEQPRRQQVVRLLPDTPPPPPPPPKPEDKPPPKPEDKPQAQDLPKPAEVPQAQALKSDEAAGDGAGSGLAAGAVSQDYSDQKFGTGNTIGGAPAEDGGNRLALNSYASAATRALNEFLARDRDVKRLDYKVRVELWLTPAGTLQRAELLGSTGDAQTDEALRTALSRFPGTGNPPPSRLPQPMRLLVSNRMMG